MVGSFPDGPDKPRARREFGTAIELYPLPPEGFAPWSASESELRKYGLPTPMAMDGNPRATAFRRAFLRPRAGQTLRFALAFGPAFDVPVPGVRPIAAIATWPTQKSLNWSGGYVTPRDGRSFASVMGHWTVPEVSEPLGGTAQEYRSSTWIGMDGQKFYLDSSLPQIGTLQKWLTAPVPQAAYSAWFQWWARGRVNPPEDLLLPVDAHDEICAIITVLDETTVRCNLKNVTKDIILQAFNASAPAPCRISGATAEWIMERPSPLDAEDWDAYDLPAYTSFPFSHCVVESVAPGHQDLRDHGLDSSRQIRMYRIEANPTAVRTLSTARRIIEPKPCLELTYVGP